jgi:hypothetical protein
MTTTREPRRDHYLQPATGADSQRALDGALDALTTLRNMSECGDAAVCLHLLASLRAELEQRLPQAVADARAQQCSWAEIADLLGVTRASAWQRYARPAGANRPPLGPD